jgi:hypothetical protein
MPRQPYWGSTEKNRMNKPNEGQKGTRIVATPNHFRATDMDGRNQTRPDFSGKLGPIVNVASAVDLRAAAITESIDEALKIQ